MPPSTWALAMWVALSAIDSSIAGNSCDFNRIDEEFGADPLV
jgi:hypothetical protein